MIGMAAVCSNAEQTVEKKAAETTKQETKTITYLDEKYTIPAKVTPIAGASLESMEDAVILGIKTVGAITIGGKLPEYLAMKLQGAESIGEKTQPNYETLLKLKPDVMEKLNKIAPMFPVLYISTNWEDNLRLMAELTGKQDLADKTVNQYKEDAEKMKKFLFLT